jgi:DNA excision repair protein ERCC-5
LVKRAVDASIWIYQFIQSMRDQDGNALENGDLLGFFRRICKLLFHDIEPIFVFDGGAPSLRGITIVSRSIGIL